MPSRKGSPNKRSEEARKQLESLNCDPLEGMATMAHGRIPCRTCEGKGTAPRAVFHKLTGTKYPSTDTLEEIGVSLDEYLAGEVACPSCGGEEVEIVPLDIRAQMYKELGNYWAPKRKAVDHRGDSVDRIVFLSEEDKQL